MTADEHGVPGPTLDVLMASGVSLMVSPIRATLSRIVDGAMRLESYYLSALALGATREEAKAALCGSMAPTVEDLDAALRRLKGGSSPMSEVPMSPFGGILHAFLDQLPDGGPPHTFAWAVPEREEAAPEPRPLTRRERNRHRRMIAQAFDVPLWMTGIGAVPLAIDGHAYRRRQRNRVKRRRR